MATQQDYWKWYGKLQKSTDFFEVNQKFLSLNAAPLNLVKARTLLSIGAGTGLLDSYLVSEYMPEIEHYIGVDSHKPSCDELHTTMGRFSNLKVSIVNESFLEWQGPDSSVDVILASHILYLYQVPDPIAAIRQLLGWLKPGGSLIIVLACEESTYGKIAEEVFQVSGFKFNSLRALLQREGIPFTDHGKTSQKFHTDCNDEEMLKLNFRYVVVHDFTDTQMTELVRTFKDRYKGSHCENIDIGYIEVKKPEI